MFCVNCGTKIEEGIKICPTCGNAVNGVPNEPVAPMVQQQSAPIPPRPMADEMYCHSCGSVIKKIAEICPKCGVKQTTAPYSQNAPAGKNNIVYLVFTILFTVLGILMFFVTLLIPRSPYSTPDYSLPVIVVSGIMSISILFSIISLYRKPNKMYFWFCISPCILLVMWSVIFLMLVL